jgi:hypothetical protein
MEIERKTKTSSTVTISRGELVLLNNALNEVCNGVAIDDDEFQTRLGADRKNARKLLAELGRLLGETG